MHLKNKNISKLLLLILFCLLTSCKHVLKQGIGESSEVLAKKTAKISFNTLEGSLTRLSNSLDKEQLEYISKNFDDDVIKRLSSDLIGNKELVDFINGNKVNVLVWQQFGDAAVRKNINVLEYFSTLINSMGEKGFKANYKIVPTSESVLLKDVKSDNLLAEIYHNALYANFGKEGKWLNKFLNEKILLPNHVYNVDGQKFIVNNLGQYKSVSGTLKPPYKNKSVLTESQKNLALADKNAIQNQTFENDLLKPIFKDEAIMLVPSNLQGGSELINLIPISRKHLGPNGEWTKMVEQWSEAIRKNEKVSYKIDFQLADQLKRPNQISVTYEINGKRFTNQFDNNFPLIKELKESKVIDLNKVFGKTNLDEIGTILKKDLIKKYKNGVPIYNEKLLKFLKSDPQAGEAYALLANFGKDIRLNDRHLKNALSHIKNNNGDKLVLEDISRTPSWLTREMKANGKILKSPTGVSYVWQTIEKNGVILKGLFPDFRPFSTNIIKIPESILKKGREDHFTFFRQSLKEQYEANPEKFLSEFRKQNKAVLKRDLVLFNKNKKEILALDKKRLNGTISEFETKRYKEITENITFKTNGKGKPFKMYDEKEVLEKQIKDVTDPSSGTKDRVFGYVMHHEEKNGEIMLVQTFQHKKNVHSGGYLIDGGGIE